MTQRAMNRELNSSAPAAVVQHISLPHRKLAVGQVQHLAELVAAHGITYPALIVIGGVVGIGRELPHGG